MGEQSCEACRYWKQGDLSAKQIGNVGTCTRLLPQTTGFYDKNRRSPFWAQGITHQTTSWEGKDCPTFKEREKADG